MVDLPKDVVQELERAGAVAEAAVAMVDRYPEEYRVPILVSLLQAAGASGRATRQRPVSGDPRGSADRVLGDEGAKPTDGLRAAASAAGVDPVDLERIVHLGDGGALRLLLGVGGASKAERTTRAAVVYCFIREHGFGQQDVGIEELRRLCKEQQAYDPANFARSLQKSPWLLVIGEPRSKKKKYRLSPQGEETAKTILQELLDA